MDLKRSEELFKQAREVMVGGVNSPVRSFLGVGGNPLVMKYGKGVILVDEDQKEYTDYCLSWGALILGHAHRNVVLAAKKTAESGISFGTTTKSEIDLARFITRAVPSIEMIRFVNSGTEATMSAIRLARGFTGRPMIVKFDGCYHGHSDDLLTTAGSGVAGLPESSSNGIPQKHIENTLSLPYNNAEILARTLELHKDQIACVIIEPVAGNMGTIVPDAGFLKILRELTTKYGILLIFDEIITGFRFRPGCVQDEFGIAPDLTCLGKIIGGGFPVGAYGGRKDIMSRLSPLGDVYQAGTFAGAPVVMRAGMATLKLLSKEFYQTLNERSRQFAESANLFFEQNNLEARLSHYGPMMSLRFSLKPVNDYKSAQAASNGKEYARVFHHLLKAGIYWPPADLETFFISGLHKKKDLDTLLEELKAFFLPERQAPVTRKELDKCSR
ncbi:MAG: glutamate-1-semialdehyde 2,1-aminomutase [Candidatus Omnitrophota bacterium]|nr:glutamate-1-semialdehyde 2,1-aminomutase [Candidatus Omnitrophota bacterium]MDZ4241781.1 glutamate-1-semialdehyde 2,1-aminomutase [Candidatus Omnitrophota bacterium]